MTTAASFSFFLATASHIFFMAHWVKMRDINAGSIPALVIQFFTKRNWANKFPIGQPMSPHCGAAYSECSITKVCFCSSPNPT